MTWAWIGVPAVCVPVKVMSTRPARALSDQNSVAIEVEGKRFEWAAMDRLRCDWAKRYGLLDAEGPAFVRSMTDFPIPDTITPEAVCSAMRDSDRMQRPGYTAIVERCFTECPVRGHHTSEI